MPTVPLHPPHPSRTASSSDSGSIPPLLQTPLGLAIMELQGHINVPAPEAGSTSSSVGRLIFPDYTPEFGKSEGAWMKKVWFYIGHQRMLGQVKKLPKPLAVICRKGALDKAADEMHIDSQGEVLEVLEIVKWKIIFASRPEPVGEGDID